MLHRKSKHFATHYHFAREKVADESLVVKYIPAAQQLVDVFTKSLPQHSFYNLRYKLGVEFPPTLSLSRGIRPKGPERKNTLGSSHDRPITPLVSSTVTKTTRQNKAISQVKRTAQPATHLLLCNRFDALLGEGE